MERDVKVLSYLERCTGQSVHKDLAKVALRHSIVKGQQLGEQG